MSLNTISSGICRRIGLRYRAVYDEFQFESDLAGFVGENRIEFLTYGNADIEYVRQLPQHKGFHIIRDPRDIVVSAYYSHLHSHPTESWAELEPHREKLQGMSRSEGIAEEIRFRNRSFSHMRNWDYEQSDILEIRFEDLALRNYETLLNVYEHLGLVDGSDYQIGSRFGGIFREVAATLNARLGWHGAGRTRHPTIPAAELLTLAWRNRFEAKSKGRNKGEEDVASHYRKGRSGDWQDHFESSHKSLFKELYPDLIPGLGYAKSDDW